MLELYHHGSSVCAAKVRLCLEEKQLDWQGHYIDILKGEQFTEAYRAINPKAVVPSLVHDGFVVNDSTVICEYLEDVFPSPALRPSDPKAHAMSLIWTKAVDEQLHPLCGELTFAASHRFTVLRLGEEKVKEFLDSTPPESVTLGWHNRKKEIVQHGFEAPGMSKTVKVYESYLQRMEKALSENVWLAGQQFSFADSAMIPYVMRLEMLSMDGIWTNDRLPQVTEWIERCKQRDSFKPAIWDWLPDKLKHDLQGNGKQSWPQVATILEIGN